MATQYQRKPFQFVFGKMTNPQQFKNSHFALRFPPSAANRFWAGFSNSEAEPFSFGQSLMKTVDPQGIRTDFENFMMLRINGRMRVTNTR